MSRLKLPAPYWSSVVLLKPSTMMKYVWFATTGIWIVSLPPMPSVQPSVVPLVAEPRLGPDGVLSSRAVELGAP